MGLPRGSTLYIRMWTRRTCGACGATFRLLCRRAVPAGEVEEGATAPGVEGFFARIEATGATHYCPCPECGWVQPDMVAGWQRYCHEGATFLGTLALLGNMAVAGFGATDRAIHVYIAAAIGVVAALLHAAFTMYNPNRSRDAGLRVARAEIDRKRVQLVERGEKSDAPTAPSRSIALVWGFALLLASVALTLAPLGAVVRFWVGLGGGAALFVAGGGVLTASAAAIRAEARDRKVDEVNSDLVTGRSIPADFRDFVRAPGRYAADWPTKRSRPAEPPAAADRGGM